MPSPNRPRPAWFPRLPGPAPEATTSAERARELALIAEAVAAGRVTRLPPAGNAPADRYVRSWQVGRYDLATRGL